jgi:hypothetical protein
MSWKCDINPVRGPRKPGSTAQELSRNLDHDLGSDLEEAITLVGQINESRFR